uniref:PDZ domain containing 11 n=1 Tax=Anas zonorhyncha TaxID=75864 RepID=A0A8B9UY19_9AVES
MGATTRGEGDTGGHGDGGSGGLLLPHRPLLLSPLLLPSLLPLTAALPPRLQQRAHAVPTPHRRPQEAARGAGRTPPGTPSSSSNPPPGAEGGEELPATSRELLLCAMVGVCLVLQLGFNIRGGKASQLGIFISKVCPMGAGGTATGPVCVPWPLPLMNVLHGHGEGSCGQAACPVWEGSCGVELLPLPCPSQVIPDSDAHRAGLQEGDQVLSVNDVDFQDIEHSKAVEILKTAREITMRVRYFPYNYQRQKERTVH